MSTFASLSVLISKTKKKYTFVPAAPTWFHKPHIYRSDNNLDRKLRINLAIDRIGLYLFLSWDWYILATSGITWLNNLSINKGKQRPEYQWCNSTSSSQRLILSWWSNFPGPSSGDLNFISPVFIPRLQIKVEGEKKTETKKRDGIW